jgi:hypothetical protein
MLGYEYYERLGTRDAFLNAAMILGGMGPVKTDLSEDGKLFAGIYALYSGLVFVVAAGVLVAPLLHRLLHSFHYDLDDGSERPTGAHRPGHRTKEPG